MRTPIFALCALVASPVLAAQPAFNCEYAKQDTEILLCYNEELAALDQLNSRIWYEVKAQLSPRMVLMYNQQGRDWIKQRNACGFDVVCVRRAYSDHFHQMCQYVNWTTPSCQVGHDDEH